MQRLCIVVALIREQQVVGQAVLRESAYAIRGLPQHHQAGRLPPEAACQEFQRLHASYSLRLLRATSLPLGGFLLS